MNTASLLCTQPHNNDDDDGDSNEDNDRENSNDDNTAADMFHNSDNYDTCKCMESANIHQCHGSLTPWDYIFLSVSEFKYNKQSLSINSDIHPVTLHHHQISTYSYDIASFFIT